MKRVLIALFVVILAASIAAERRAAVEVADQAGARQAAEEVKRSAKANSTGGSPRESVEDTKARMGFLTGCRDGYTTDSAGTMHCNEHPIPVRIVP
jgi:hypothetical protein